MDLSALGVDIGDVTISASEMDDPELLAELYAVTGQAPAPRPPPAANQRHQLEQQALGKKREALRLKAAAMGVPWLPTRSLLGSSMERDNAHALTVTDDPDGQGQVALVHALRPDLSLVHAWMADPHGNAVFGYPQAENAYGALAAREGAIVTAEHIVDSATLRRHAHLVQLPGDYVRAVCHAPWGAHPGGMSCAGVPGFQGYAEDYDFVDEAREAGADSARFKAWIDEWVLGCETPDAYAERLGEDRRDRLRRRADDDAAGRPREIPPLPPGPRPRRCRWRPARRNTTPPCRLRHIVRHNSRHFPRPLARRLHSASAGPPARLVPAGAGPALVAAPTTAAPITGTGGVAGVNIPRLGSAMRFSPITNLTPLSSLRCR